MSELYYGTIKVTPNIQRTILTNLNVNLDTHTQVILPGNADGFTSINVPAVTNSIDINIKSNNIKSGVSILGVTGSVNTGDYVYLPRLITEDGVCRKPKNYTFSLPNTVHDIGSYSLGTNFIEDTQLIAVDLSSLTNISNHVACYHAFYKCTNLTSVDLSNLETVSGKYALSSAFEGCTKLTSIDLSSLTTISGDSALFNTFEDCARLTSVDLSSLETVSGSHALYNAFHRCTNLTSVDLSSLTTVSGSHALDNAFSGCSNLSTINFNNLTQIGLNEVSRNTGHFQHAFSGCNKITQLNFPKLESIYCAERSYYSEGTFDDNDTIQKIYFPKLSTISHGTNTYYSDGPYYIFKNCSALTELHFGAENQSAIEASTGYSTAWGRGAGNVTIYFDL